MPYNKISFATTAMLRPKILNETYTSLSRSINIDLKKVKLYLNVDPSPTGINPMDVVNVAINQFGEVVYRVSESSNFTAAVNWLWTNADSEFLFHIEDDWTWLKRFSVELALDNFKQNKKLLMLRFRYKNVGRNFNFGLTPCIVRKEFYKSFAGKLDITQNPESQIYDSLKFGVPTPKMGVNVIQWNNKIMVKDIGRNWKEKNKIELINYDKSPGDVRTFVNWK